MSYSNTDDWGFASVWNKALENADQRPLVPRDYLWASELGKAPVDVFLRLQGEQASNPPNARSLRKFEAGNVFEWIISLILKRAGILIDDQKRCEHQYPNLLKVTGKADFIAGGVPDFARAIAELKALDMPEVFVRAAEALKDHFETNYPHGLLEKPIEIKSVSSFMFESLLKAKKPMKHHRLQEFHYQISHGYETGSIVYISRDDMRLLEFTVLLSDPKNETDYKEAIERLSVPYQTNTQPELEEMVLFDEDMGKFTTNFNVAYSGYLTKLYGIKDQAEYDKKYKKIPAQYNRVMNRFKEGKKMTKANLEIMADITNAGFDTARIAQKFVGTTPSDEDDTEDDA